MIKSQCLGFLNTPALWEKNQFDIEQFQFPRINLKLFQPQALPGNIRLGHQMEYVFKQLIEFSETYEVVLYNLPVSDNTRTLGEIDFILKDKTRNKLIHVELTYKFYIIDPEIIDPIERLIGPNRRDSFLLKMEKIKNVQFPLLHSEEGAKALSKIDVDHTKVVHQCCFKAQLFQPFGSDTPTIGSLNKDCFVGYWLRFADLNKSEFANTEYYIPSKSEWPIEPYPQVVWRSRIEILEDIKLSMLQERASLVWLKNSKTEFEKLFVVWW